MEENGSHLANCRWEECHWHSGAHPRTFPREIFWFSKVCRNPRALNYLPPLFPRKSEQRPDTSVFLLEGVDGGRSLITWSEKFLPRRVTLFNLRTTCVFLQDVCCGARTEIATALRAPPCGVRLAATLPRKLVGSPGGPWWIGWVVWPKRFVAVEEADVSAMFHLTLLRKRGYTEKKDKWWGRGGGFLLWCWASVLVFRSFARWCKWLEILDASS